MELRAKYSIGERVFVLRDGRMAEIEIKTILVDNCGIRYSENGGTVIFKSYPEARCFRTRKEFVDYISKE